MPITINCGLSKKVGTANYGSVGASCNIAFEAEHDLLDSDLASFHQKVRNAYVACAQAVKDELAREQGAEIAANGSGHTAASNLNDHANNGDRRVHGNSHANNGQTGSNASEKQMAYAKQLAKSIPNLGIRRLEALVQKLCSKPLSGLTALDASGLIDTLKAIKAGEIDVDAVLPKAAT